MTIVPDPLRCCPACSMDHRVIRIDVTMPANVTVRACRQDCQRTDVNHFIDATHMGASAEPHLHVACDRCGFVYLLAVADDEAFKRAW